jgi:hypothetical protein
MRRTKSRLPARAKKLRNSRCPFIGALEKGLKHIVYRDLQ